MIHSATQSSLNKPRPSLHAGFSIVLQKQFRLKSVTLRSGPDDKEGGDVESLFSKELKRRGMLGEAVKPSEDEMQPIKTPGMSDPFSRRSSAPPPPSRAASSPPPVNLADDQRQRSMAMVNEGLEGLFPRASILVQLGSSFFLSFLPFIIVVGLFFGGTYAMFGDAFVHTGRDGSGLPAYVDPEELLREPTVDPMIPF